MKRGAQPGNKNRLGKAPWNKGLKGSQVPWNRGLKGFMAGEKNNRWNGGKDTLAYKEKVAGRTRPTHCEVCYLTAKPDFDHDHKTGLFRGWLCRRCNLVLGMIKDDQALLRRLADYLDLQSDETRPKTILSLYALSKDDSH